MRNEIYRRELNWIENLSLALSVFAANISAVIRVMVIVFLPISLLEVIISERLLNAMTIFQQVMETMSHMTTAQQSEQILQVVMQMLTNDLLLGAISLFLQPVGIIAIAKVVKQYVDGEEIAFSKALSEAFSCMPAILLTGVIYGVLILLGGLVIIPGVYYGIAWCFYLFCIGLREKSGMEALCYSKGLVKGKWLRTFVYLLALSAISLLWNSAFELLYAFAPEGTVTDVMYHFLCYFSAAFVAVGECLLFLNREAVADGACVFGTGYVNDFASAEKEDTPAEPVEGTVDGVSEEETEEVSLLEEKSENEHK